VDERVEPEVFCLIVGRSKRHHCFMFHLSPRHDDVDLIYPLWVIRRGMHVTLVDTGFAPDVAAARGVVAYRDPDELLAALAIDPRAIESVIVSHLHYDHFGFPQRYPRATFAIQNADVTYFTSTGASHPATALADPASVAAVTKLVRDRRVRLLDGDATVDGLGLLHVGGHTPGMQLTRVPTIGAPLLLACDASHFYANCETATPTAIIHTYEGYQAGFARIRAHGSRWFPGHDPKMLEQLEPVAPNVYRVPAVRSLG
jgi:glyoxylase-like metal-dependent hydrolase (beta-lactamase superfamily II)